MFRILGNCIHPHCWIIFYLSWQFVVIVADDCPNTNPAECVCQNDVIDCRGSKSGKTKLTAVPTFVSSKKSYRELDLSGNDIEVIHDNAFDALHIYKLDLTDNPIASFETNAFAGITSSLTKLWFSLSETGQFPDTSVNALSAVNELHVCGYNSADGQLHVNALKGYTSLVNLTIKDGSLSQLVAEDFKDQESTLTKLDLSNNKFTNIPALALSKLSKLETLVINQNHIMYLTNASFIGLTLKTLEMSDYSNLMINAGSFLPIKSTLTHIRLMSCQLSDQSVVAFKTLTNLNVLEIPSNTINNIHGLFDNMKNLSEANLEYNSLNYLGWESFIGVSNSLIKLRLRNNKLSLLQPNAFHSLKHLEELCMENVPGTSLLDESSFMSQTNSLKIITIESTSTEKDSSESSHICPQWEVFNIIRSIQSLNLKGCRMGNIPDHTFHLTNNLSTLNLESNKINSLSFRSFAGLENSLKNLYLRYNQITTIDHCTLRNFASLFQLQLADNPLRCECNIIWLNDYFEKSLDKGQWKCSNVGGISFETFISVNQTTCKEMEQSTTKAICYDWKWDFTTQPVPSIHLLLVNISEYELSVVWNMKGISVQDIAGFNLTYSWNENNNTYKNSFEINNPRLRSYILKDLAPDTTYNVCIEIYNRSHFSCDYFRSVAPSFPPVSYLYIIIGASLAVVLVIVVCCTVCCYLRHRRKMTSRRTNLVVKQTDDMPQVVCGSKRFVKPDLLEGQPPPMAKTLSIADQLDTLTEDARSQLLNLLNQTAGGCGTMASLDRRDYSRSKRGISPYSLGAASSKSVEYLGNSYSLERRARRPSQSVANVYNEIDDEVYDEIDV